MKHVASKMLGLTLLWPLGMQAQSAQDGARWTLQQCVDYALAHNVQLLKLQTAEQTADVNVREARAGLLPSLQGSISQALTYRPFQSSGGNFVNGGIASQGADKATESGAYGVSAQWTVWNGGRNRMNITNARYNSRLSAYDTQTQANQVAEEIAKLYIQILYMQEALQVNKALLVQDSTLCARGQEMVNVGDMARADLAQLKAQVSQGRYNVVNVATQIDDAKRQVRQWLELPADTAFDVAGFEAAEASILAVLPAKADVYQAALQRRPEVQRSLLAIEQSQLATKMARAAYLPSVSLSASLGDSHITGAQYSFFRQMKNNFNMQVGLTLSIPIYDNRQTRSAVERARLAETTAQLDLQDTQKQLWQTVETYWLNANNSQAKYQAACDNVASLTESYDLMTEQFNVGLKNIAELLNSRANLLTARQQLLEDKYTALLNRSLLDFYATSTLRLEAR